MAPPEAEICWRFCFLPSQTKQFFIIKDITLITYASDRPCFMFDVDRGFSVLYLMDFLQINSWGLALLYCRCFLKQAAIQRYVIYAITGLHFCWNEWGYFLRWFVLTAEKHILEEGNWSKGLSTEYFIYLFSYLLLLKFICYIY